MRECKGLPLALKVIGASLRDRPQMFWASAASRLSQAEPICESHETKLLERMAVGIADLPKMVRECFLDLGAFPEDKKIPLDVLINIWVEIHDLFQDDAFAVLYELAEKNLLSLVNDARYVNRNSLSILKQDSRSCDSSVNCVYICLVFALPASDGSFMPNSFILV